MSVRGTTKFCQGISDISDSYSGFIIDQWGVLHDGEKPYEGVIDCLKELKSRNKFIIILSNSGKRAEQNKQRLKEVGIGPSLYDVIMTSGEMTWQGLKNQDDGFFKDIGKKAYVISRGGDTSIIDGAGIETTTDINEADFLIISGSDAPKMSLEDYEPILKAAVRRRLKAVCANPDTHGIMGDQIIIGAGGIAARYSDFGGVVSYIGKPHQPIFQYCTKILQEKEIYPGQTVVIGDTMGHDIMGGALMNMDTCLVRDGLHKPAFQNARDAQTTDKALTLLVNQYNQVRPTYLVNRLQWGKALPDRKHRKRTIKK